MRRLVHRPSPALVVACAALLLALTGTGIAAVEATVPNNSVGSAQLKSNAVTAAKIASNAVTSAKIASNAVANAKIAANAVTTDKVKDASLLAADFKAGELPAASAGFARFLNGPVVVPTSSASVATLAIPQAGNYLIWGKAYFTAVLATVVNCRLQAEGDFDQSQVSPVAGAPETMALNVAHTFTAAGTVDLRCDGSVAGGQANFVKLSALQVANLANSG